MKKVFLIFTLLLSSGLFAQRIKVPYNVFSLETGIYDKGLFAFGHTFNFCHSQSTYIAIESSIGFPSHDIFGPSYFVIAPSINFGEQNKFFTLGVQNKYINNVSYYVVDNAWGFPFLDNLYYKGYGLSPFVGYNYFGKKGFNFKVRAGVTQLFKNTSELNKYETNPRRRNLLFTCGVSFGIFKSGKKIESTPQTK